MGDPRLTSYFYAFDGGQGDLFINAVTQNFNGDIDVFAADALRSLTKMVVYAETEPSETGRLIYLRKPERLILRIQGRTPNDDAATFRIKFGGSFIALSGEKDVAAPAIKTSDAVAESGVRVNSVGTIVEVIPKPQPTPKPTPERKEIVAAVVKKTESVKKATPEAVKTPKNEPKENVSAAKTVETKPASPPTKKAPVKGDKDVTEKETAVASSMKKPSAPKVKTVFNQPNKPKSISANKKPAEKPQSKPKAPPVEKKPDPLASIRLVVELKDGKVIERPMSEVEKFSVDNGVLTVLAKDGKSVKYSILEVAKVTIE